METSLWLHIGLVAGVVLPFFNLAQIIRMIRCKSSHDISLTWGAGVWTSLMLMLPAALVSSDRVFHYSSIVNIFLFSALLGTAIYYRIKKHDL